MKTLLIGAGGQLAREIERAWPEHGPDSELVPIAHQQLEIRDARAVRELVSAARPQCIINTAAFHRVDLCEDEPENAFAVNEGGVRNLAEAAREHGALFVHFSTDYVFAGDRRVPYVESDEAWPISVYGKSRLAGERAVAAAAAGGKCLILRTCGLYGVAGRQTKLGNFPETMLKAAAQGRALRVVDDQICTPTSARELAVKSLALMKSGATGLFHMTNTGQCSWHEFAAEIFRRAGIKADLSPCTAVEYAAKAPRPAYSVLDNRALRRAGIPEFRPWQEALAEYMRARSGNT